MNYNDDDNEDVEAYLFHATLLVFEPSTASIPEIPITTLFRTWFYLRLCVHVGIFDVGWLLPYDFYWLMQARVWDIIAGFVGLLAFQAPTFLILFFQFWGMNDWALDIFAPWIIKSATTDSTRLFRSLVAAPISSRWAWYFASLETWHRKSLDLICLSEGISVYLAWQLRNDDLHDEIHTRDLICTNVCCSCFCLFIPPITDEDARLQGFGPCLPNAMVLDFTTKEDMPFF